MTQTQTTLRDYLQTTEDAISSGRVDDALAKCQYILKRYPDSLEAQRLLGEVYLAQGKLEEAQRTFDWILTNDPENVIVYCDRALISEQMSDYDIALDCYQQAYELSRGNNQIRQEFNLLSQKVGLQGFIFSRAGLARLYMRGDLLPQAIREWETVLAINPDRLDARTGLLETCWREGLYDRVERLSSALLNDIPGCLKALLLLSHIMFVRNPSVAKELIRRAEALDPDYVMAQELFSDLMASQPNDPFLALLDMSPIVLVETPINQSAPTITSSAHDASMGKNDSLDNAMFSDASLLWSSLDDIIGPEPTYQIEQEESTSATLPSSNTTAIDDTWNLTYHIEDAAAQNDHKPELGQTRQEDTTDSGVTISLDQTLSDQQSWSHSNPLDEAILEPAYQWSNADSSSPTPWETVSQELESPSPPAWLEMLTRGEWHQPDEAMSTLPATSPVEQEPTLATQPAQQIAEAEVATSQALEEELDTLSTPIKQEESSSIFGPEWLKSLGATSIEQMLSNEMTIADPVAMVGNSMSDTSSLTPSKTTETTLSEESEPLQKTSLESWLEQAAQKLSNPELNVITTLEALDEDLRSHGFMSLEPGSLSTISSEAEITLSSALAQFGNYESGPAPESTHESDHTALVEEEMPPTATPKVPAEAVHAPVALLSTINDAVESTLMPSSHMEASTSSTANSASDLPANPSADPTQVDIVPDATTNPSLALVHEDAVLSPDAASDSLQTDNMQVSTPETSLDSVKTDDLPGPSFEATPVQDFDEPQAPTALTSKYTGTVALLETELEKTMKRPVTRLQPIQQSASVQESQPVIKEHSEARSIATNAKSVNMGPKERLQRGYQLQIAGSYDEAMQEYRVLIRNSPELLSDVVMNMRALLKVAPKYAAGYRVLGDAYMRQGEYLQAMEVYNKALSISKKAKG